MNLRELIEQAVRDAIRHAEQPLGMLLSGGVDSSTVAAFAGPVPTFTGWYDMEGFSEVQFARIAARCPQKDHYFIKITPADFVENFDAMARAIDPFHVGTGVFGQWMVAKFVASQGIKTLFSGEGGDELFGGYARLLKVAGLPMPEGYENYQMPDGYPDNVADALAYDWDSLPTLMKADEQICQAWGITVTPPMMDRRVVDYALSLPPQKRIGKVELKQAMRGIVPDMILDRKSKMGFPAPYVLWAQEEPVWSFVTERIGYIPDIQKPYARAWWYDLCRVSKERIQA
jgi:asparagine synthetase B (glutamine-hydrolysing)